MKKLFLLVLFVAQYLWSDGQFLLDTSFNTPSLEEKLPRGFNLGIGNAIGDMALQKDGKLIVVGSFEDYNGRKRNRICRILSNGEIDEGFLTGSGFNATANIVKIQNDGKILIAGRFNVYNNIPCAGLVRLNENGTVDKTFNLPTRIQGTINDVLPTEDGKIFIAGRFNQYNNVSVKGVVRLLSDGSVDNTFALPGGFDGGVNSIAIQKNKIIIGGDFTFNLGSGLLISKLTRLTASGSFDITYNASGKGFETSGGNVVKVYVQPDNKILVSGNFKKYNDNVVNRFIRINENGWLDKKFNNNSDSKKFGSVEGEINKIYCAADGSIYLGGEFESFGNNIRFGFVKLDAQGNVVREFYDNNVLTGQRPIITSFAVLPSGEYIIGGRFEYISGFKRNSIALLDNRGSISKKLFFVSKGVSGPVTHIIPFKGKLLLAGKFNFYDDEVVNGITLIDEKGERDPSFNFSSVSFSTEAISDVKVLKNGQILLAGIFNPANANNSHKLLKLNDDGSVEESFYIGASFDNYVYSIDEQSDGKIIVGGDFKKVDGISKVGIIRINIDGSIDNSFNSNNNLDLFIKKIIVDKETDKIFVSGRYTHPSKKVYINLQRLMPNGTIDNTFNFGLFENKDVKGFTIDNKKRILAYGGLNTPANARTEIIRVDYNGNYDPSFLIDPKFYKYGNFVNRVIVLPTNDLMVGFQSPPNGDIITENNSIIRLNDNGTVNTGFKFSSNMNLGTRGEMFGTLNSSILLTNNTLLVGGNFNFIDNHYINYLAKLKVSSSVNSVKQTSAAAKSNKSESENDAPLNALAKALFKNKKTLLTNEQKNLLSNTISDFKIGKNGVDYYIINDKDDYEKPEDDLIPVRIGVEIFDLNNDGKDEVIIQMFSSMYGREGSPIFVYSIVNGQFERILNESGISVEINTNTKNGYKEIALIDGYGDLKKPDGRKYTIYKFKKEDYQMLGKVALTPLPKWEKIESLSAKYQSSIK